MHTNSDFSARVSAISVSGTMKVAADAERLRRAGVDVVDFGAGEPDFPTPPNVKQAAIRALAEDFTRYTSVGGTVELREAVCRRHALDYGTRYTPAECAITVGGKHAVFNAVQVLINPGDEVIIPVPYWVTYKDVVHYAGGRCRLVETDANDGFHLTAGMIEPAFTPKTKAIILNSPCNPSGAVFAPAELGRILELARRHGAWLISDECYCRFVYSGAPFSVASLAEPGDKVAIVGSLSKTYAMTGWRIGFILAPAPVVAAVLKLQSHSTSNPNSIAQKAAVEALTGPQDSVAGMLAEYRRRRDYVLGRLRAIPGVRVAEPMGAFYAYPDIRCVLGKPGVGNGIQFAERLLEEARVAVVPGEAFGTHTHARISYATSMHELERGLDRIRAFFTAL